MSLNIPQLCMVMQMRSRRNFNFYFLLFLLCIGVMIPQGKAWAQCSGDTVISSDTAAQQTNNTWLCSFSVLSGKSITTTASFTYGLLNNSTITTLNNAGTISTSGFGANAINNLGTLTTLNNAGTISTSGSSANAIINRSILTTLSNTGTISTSASDTHVISNRSILTTLSNTGTISASGMNARGVSNLATGTITTLTNTGTISSSNSVGIFNLGTFTTLNNLQGASSSALTYSSNLPTNYNIIINSAANYGKLTVTSATGNTSFGISALSTGVTSGTYTSVLSGLASSNLSATSGSSTVSGTTYTWSLAISSGTTWDLTVAGGSSSSSSSSSAFSSSVSSSGSRVAKNAASVLDAISASPGAMTNVISALSALSGTAQSKAISQTLPTTSSSKATTGAVQALSQVVQGRMGSLRGMSSGDDYIGTRDVWMKGFGSWAKQNDIDGESGYKINTGGLALGIDKGLTPQMNIGTVLAFFNSSVNNNGDTAPGGMSINGYQVGIYGDYAFDPKLIANASANIGLNQNKGYRNITFMGTNANSNYNSYSGHLGAGIKYLLPIDMENTVIPGLRMDYTKVRSQGYTESGADALNLSVSGQTYDTLIPGADLRIDHALNSTLILTANAGAGYNILNNQVSLNSAYQGGGTTFATTGLQVSPWTYNAGVGVTGMLNKHLQLNLRYDNVFSTTGYMNQMISAKLNIPI
jgi:outer membrane autotransporter protein